MLGRGAEWPKTPGKSDKENQHIRWRWVRTALINHLRNPNVNIGWLIEEARLCPLVEEASWLCNIFLGKDRKRDDKWGDEHGDVPSFSGHDMRAFMAGEYGSYLTDKDYGGPNRNSILFFLGCMLSLPQKRILLSKAILAGYTDGFLEYVYACLKANEAPWNGDEPDGYLVPTSADLEQLCLEAMKEAPGHGDSTYALWLNRKAVGNSEGKVTLLQTAIVQGSIEAIVEFASTFRDEMREKDEPYIFDLGFIPDPSEFGRNIARAGHTCLVSDHFCRWFAEYLLPASLPIACIAFMECLTEGRRFAFGTLDDMKPTPALSMYQENYRGTREAAVTWCLCARRMGVVADVRRIIAKLIWPMRYEALYYSRDDARHDIRSIMAVESRPKKRRV